MVATKFTLKYDSNIGFASDQGGRGFLHPCDIAIRSDRRIFVASRGRGPSVGIQMVSRDLEFFGTIGSKGKDIGQMLEPSALAFDSAENLYVADEKLNRITRFDYEGAVIDSWGVAGSEPGQFDHPTGLLIINDVVFVVDAFNHRIQKYTTNGDFIDQWGYKGSSVESLKFPWGIDGAINGDIYVADWGNDRVVRFTQDGEFVSDIHKGEGADLYLNRPADVAVDHDDNMFVADWGNQVLQVFDRDGNFLDLKRGEADLNAWAIEYLEAQQDEKIARSTYVPVYDTDTDDVREISARIEPFFWDPCSVTLDENGRVYVLETCRHRFQIFERI